MMVVIIEFEMRADMESEFEAALKHMQEQVKSMMGFWVTCPAAVSKTIIRL